MKYPTATGLLLCLLGASPFGTYAQQNSWMEFSADAEYFHVAMPSQPKEERERASYGSIEANGKKYEAYADGAGYILWSLVNERFNAFQATDPDSYLDDCADLVWESLLKSARDKLPDDQRSHAAMTYVKELPTNPFAGREYSVAIGDVAGTIHFYIAQTRIFVLMAVNSPQGVWARERFLGSFTVLPNLPLHSLNYGDPKSRTTNTTRDEDRVFTGREVTQKVRVLAKREPTYTESARKYGIQGTVILRAVFSRDGEVTNISVVRKLPHGLTQQAIRAARGIKFTPATKDGREVSMYMELQYNFNLF